MKMISRAGAFFSASLLLLFAFPALPAQAEERMPPNAHISAVAQFMHEVNPKLAAPIGIRYARAVLADAETTQVDPCLLLAVVGVESHFKSDAVSKHGAVGLGQLLPSTAEDLHVDPSLPLANLWGTSQYLRSLLDRFAFQPSRERTAIAAYNAGPGAVERNHGGPTSRANAVYVERVFALWQTAKQRLGVLIAPQTLPSIRETALSGDVADRQARWWMSEGSSDPVTASRAGKSILRL